MITMMIADVVAESRRRLARLAPTDPDAIRLCGGSVIAFSSELARELTALKSFLLARVYRHERVMRVMRKAEGVVCDLFARCLEDSSAMPPQWQQAGDGVHGRRRAGSSPIMLPA